MIFSRFHNRYEIHLCPFICHEYFMFICRLASETMKPKTVTWQIIVEINFYRKLNIFAVVARRTKSIWGCSADGAKVHSSFLQVRKKSLGLTVQLWLWCKVHSLSKVNWYTPWPWRVPHSPCIHLSCSPRTWRWRRGPAPRSCPAVDAGSPARNRTPRLEHTETQTIHMVKY